MKNILQDDTIKNIIFDLGGVIIDIYVPKTIEALAILANQTPEWVETKITQAQIFKLYEIGQLDDQAFRVLLQKTLAIDKIDEERLDKAWNSLLLALPLARVNLLQRLKTQYRTFLLSNTNPIHIKEVENILYKSSGVVHLKDLFEKIYLSYAIKKTKPDPAIYQYVLEQNKLLAHETLFVDDNLDNIQAAANLNIKTLHIQPFSNSILDFFIL